MKSETMGGRIRASRLHRGLTLEKLAEKAELSPSFLGHIERGTRVASMATLMRISRALEVSLDWLTGLWDAEQTPAARCGAQMDQARELLILALGLIDKREAKSPPP